MFLLMEEELSVVLSDDLISIMDKPVKERTPEEQEAYIVYLEGVWKLADRKLSNEQRGKIASETTFVSD